MNEGHTEGSPSWKQDHEKSIHGLHSHHYILLPLLWMFRLCSIRKHYTWKSPDRIRILRTLLARRLCQCVHYYSPSGRISGKFFRHTSLITQLLLKLNYYFWSLRFTASQYSHSSIDGPPRNSQTAGLSTRHTQSNSLACHLTDWHSSDYASEHCLLHRQPELQWSSLTSMMCWAFWVLWTSGLWQSTSLWRCTLCKEM